MKPKKKKAVDINYDKPITAWRAKNYYIKSLYSFKYIDTNFQGDIYLTEDDRKLIQKWEIAKTTEQSFWIKNAMTGYFLSSTPDGSLYAGLQNNSSYQTWRFYATADQKIFIVENCGSKEVLDVTIYDTPRTDKPEAFEARKSQLFAIYPMNVEKR